jgi:ABC-2 type transport system ATP-binding protein
MSDSLIKDETIVIATHLIDEIENFIDRVIIIGNGKVREDIMIDDLREKGGNIEGLMKNAFGYDPERYSRMFTS